MNQDSPLFKDISSVLYTEEALHAAVAELGQRITQDYQGKTPLMICILKGASVFFTDLIRQIDLPLEIEFMAISSYGASTVSSGEVRVNKDLDRPIQGRDVLIVEDIVDSGMTLSYLTRLLHNRGARSLKLVSLLDKPSRRTVQLNVDYSCFKIPDAFVVGYGLDYDEKYRNLPVVGVLDPKVYTK